LDRASEEVTMKYILFAKSEVTSIPEWIYSNGGWLTNIKFARLMTIFEIKQVIKNSDNSTTY